jgi:hypothetical protein
MYRTPLRNGMHSLFPTIQMTYSCGIPVATTGKVHFRQGAKPRSIFFAGRRCFVTYDSAANNEASMNFFYLPAMRTAAANLRVLSTG